MAVIAERAFISRATLQRLDDGDPGLSMGIYAAVRRALGLLKGLDQLADPSQDEVGQALASAQLPKRVRTSRTDRKRPHD